MPTTIKKWNYAQQTDNDENKINNIPILDVIDKVSEVSWKDLKYHYVGYKTKRFDWTDWYTIFLDTNTVFDFSGKGRPAWKPFNYVRQFFKFSKRKTLKWFKEHFNIWDFTDFNPVSNDDDYIKYCWLSFEEWKAWYVYFDEYTDLEEENKHCNIYQIVNQFYWFRRIENEIYKYKYLAFDIDVKDFNADFNNILNLTGLKPSKINKTYKWFHVWFKLDKELEFMSIESYQSIWKIVNTKLWWDPMMKSTTWILKAEWFIDIKDNRNFKINNIYKNRKLKVSLNDLKTNFPDIKIEFREEQFINDKIEKSKDKRFTRWLIEDFSFEELLEQIKLWLKFNEDKQHIYNEIRKFDFNNANKKKSNIYFIINQFLQIWNYKEEELDYVFWIYWSLLAYLSWIHPNIKLKNRILVPQKLWICLKDNSFKISNNANNIKSADVKRFFIALYACIKINENKVNKLNTNKFEIAENVFIKDYLNLYVDSKNKAKFRLLLESINSFGMPLIGSKWNIVSYIKPFNINISNWKNRTTLFSVELLRDDLFKRYTPYKKELLNIKTLTHFELGLDICTRIDRFNYIDYSYDYLFNILWLNQSTVKENKKKLKLTLSKLKKLWLFAKVEYNKSWISISK